MGLFPDGTSNSSGTTNSTPPVKRKLFRSESTCNNKKNETNDKKSNIQQLSTSWEFIRPTFGIQSDRERDKNEDATQDSLILPRYIEVQKGRISLVTPRKNETTKDKEFLEARIAELEDALYRLQERVEKNQCGSPTLERDLREQLESMNRALKSKDRRAMQACRDHKTLQSRFAKQENSMQLLQNENKTLHQRIRQYEHCLDDVMRKVVDAIVAEDSLRDEVIMLKNRVQDLEAQNAALSASPAKGRDEGYCTMSSGQPQPITNHLEDLLEEPEQWLISAEPCSAEMEDWSMSQEELETALEEDNNEWIWNTEHFINSTIDSNSEEIAALLQEQIIYSDDEDLACKDFTRDFYRLVNIQPESTRSLKSSIELQIDSSSDGDRTERLCSPTASECGREQVLSCSSSESSDITIPNNGKKDVNDGGGVEYGDCVNCENDNIRTSYIEDVLNVCHNSSSNKSIVEINNSTKSSWRRSTGWRRVSTQFKGVTTSAQTNLIYSSKSPPLVPARRSFAS